MTKNIQHWNPFESLIPTNPFAPVARRNPFGGLFEDFLNGESMKNALTSDFGFKIVDHKDTREYQFALPGVPSDQIDVQVTGNLLSIAVDYKGKDMQRVYRSNVTLPSHVDPEKITSSYQDGLLSIHVPSETEPTVKIPVTAGKSNASQHQISTGEHSTDENSTGEHAASGFSSENDFEKKLSDSDTEVKTGNEKPAKHSGFQDLPTSQHTASDGAGIGGRDENDASNKS